MYTDTFSALSQSAQAKTNFLQRNLSGYFLSAMLAGIMVGFGVLLSYTAGGMLAGVPAVKLVMGAVFAVALSLVIIAGSELFTGNNLVMTAGFLEKTVPASRVLKLWVICYAGNWMGSILLAFIFYGTGLAEGATAEVMAAAAAVKMNVPFFPLLLRAALCNTLVCLAVWCGFRCKSESGKLIMVFWCILVFFTSGFEHSIANMTLLTVTLLNPVKEAIGLGGYFYNILTVTLGNMLGGIAFTALPYYLISRKGSGILPEKENSL
jgi:nitrite transporter NirC